MDHVLVFVLLIVVYSRRVNESGIIMRRIKIVKTILIPSINRGQWIELACSRNRIPPPSHDHDEICVRFGESVKPKNLEAFHMVILSCLIEELKTRGYLIIIQAEKELYDYLFSDINIRAYWGSDPVPHVDCPDISNLNIWRIDDKYKDAYAISVERYLQRHFTGKDVSFMRTALNELYYNIFDHAEANGNAFSYIHFDQEKERIYVAVCDFGEGVAKTLRGRHSEFEDDETALRESIRAGVSANTTSHNRGFGLDVICSSLEPADSFRMISNNALLFQNNGEVKTFGMKNLYFKGTLIYFDFSTRNFGELEETLNDIEL